MNAIINPTNEQRKKLKGIVYGFRNKINGKYYIGQTVQTFNQRYRADKWANAVKSVYFKNAVQKYGQDSFEITIFEIGIDDIKELNRLEHKYATELNSYHPNGYNLIPCGDGKGKATPEMLARFATPGAKEWDFKNIETGEVFHVKNLSKFCKERNLCRGTLGMMIRTGKGQHKGFASLNTTVSDVSNAAIFRMRPNIPKGPYTIWKDGESKTFVDIHDFMKKEGLIDLTHFCDLLDGKTQAHKGYSLKPGEIVWQTRRYFDIRLKDKFGNITTYNSIKDCAIKTGMKESPIRQMIYGNRTESDEGYSLVDFKHKVPGEILLIEANSS